MDMLSARAFAKVGKVKKAVARFRGYDICPLCGEIVKPMSDDGEFWSMECRNPKCHVFMNIESDLWDTKKAAIEAYRRAIGIFTSTCDLTCRCNKCGGVLKQSGHHDMMAKPYELRCMNCGNSVNEATEIECIKAWNDKNYFDRDADFKAKWEKKGRYETYLSKLASDIAIDKSIKHRG